MRQLAVANGATANCRMKHLVEKKRKHLGTCSEDAQ